MQYRSLTQRVGNAVRLAEVVRVLVRHGFADLLRRGGLYESIPAKVLRGLRIMEPQHAGPESLGARMRAALTELGPTFVKFGQILSTRPDLVGRELSLELSKLQDSVRALPFETMRPTIEEAVGAPVNEYFAEFSPEPVAAASIAQVYRARLRTGEAVAVKVQRPGAARIIEADLGLMRGTAGWIADHVEDVDWLDPVGMVEEFERAIRRELDFNIEARVLQRFHKNYQGDPHVFIPKTYPCACSARVLTMDWIDGIRVDNRDGYDARHSDPRVVAINGCETLCRQVFEFCLFHADPHPGNVLVTQYNQLAFLDYGMVGHLERTDVVAMADLLKAVFDNDTDECVRAMLAFTVSGDVEDVDALKRHVSEYLAFEAETIIGGGQVGKAIERVTEILRRHRLQLAPRFSMLLKALSTIESTGHQLDENLDMVPIIKPYIQDIVATRYAPMQLWRDLRQNLHLFMRLGRDIPSNIHNLLRMLRRGNLHVRLAHEGLKEFATVTDRASNRITFGLITGALIVGSSMLVASGRAGQNLGLAGYIIAGVLGLMLLFSILRSRNI